MRAKKFIAAGLAGCLLLSQSLPAQPAYEDVTATHLPEILGRCMDAAVGDADGDGDPDLALAMEFEPNLLLLNDGQAHFAFTTLPFPSTVHDSEEVDLADFDGDGDLDLLFVSEDDEVNEFYLNDGKGGFTDASERIPVGDVSNSHAVLDLDEDGDFDILIGNIGSNRVLINDGAAHFSDESAQRWPNEARTQDIELADVDNDGDLDAITANEGQNRLFLNDGRGRLVPAPMSLPVRGDESREIRAADVDGDGDVDLLVANVRFLTRGSRVDILLLNDGGGSFSEAPEGALPALERNHFSVQALDLDGDGDSDLLLPHSEVSSGGGNTIALLNDGRGNFSRESGAALFPGPLPGNTFDIEVADLNADGREDLFFCNRRATSAGDPLTREGGLSRLLLRRVP